MTSTKTTNSILNGLNAAPTSELVTVDIDAIEQQKENIQPLSSGRSALQLTTLSTQSRSGLGEKLTEEHTRFQNALEAVDIYETNAGVWEDGKFDLSSEAVATMSEDPLDIHHQYARFVLNSYPAGPSSSSRLLPLLESSTRKFLTDERYTNDPRYLRLWNLYAKNMEYPEDCYRFLFAKGIGERLAILYEEYALVLESAGKRTEANQIYLLGQHRFAAPLERLKKRHQAFQARMLVAPPLSESPPPVVRSSATSRDARAVLGGASLPPAPSTSGAVSTSATSSAIPANGAKGFAVFQDTAVDANRIEGGSWEDLGTNKSRRRENEVEAVEWKGETMPMIAKKSGGGVGKLEVFRDDDAPPVITAAIVADPLDTPFSRSIRGPSEAELLRQNPFKNYSAPDLSLSGVDPLVTAALADGELKKKKDSKKDGSKKSSSSTPGSVKKSSKSSSATTKSSTSTTAKATGPVTERVACPLSLIYPLPGVEVSLEELKMRSRIEYSIEVETWRGWKWRKEWAEEVKVHGDRPYLIDPVTSWPVLFDSITQEPLYNFLPQPVKAMPIASFSQSPEQSPLTETESASPVQLALISPSTRSQLPLLIDSISPPPLSPSPSPSPVHRSVRRRPPSPTMNTKQAQSMMDNLFSKTINFDDFNEEEEEEKDDDGSASEEEERDVELCVKERESSPASQESFGDSQSQLQPHYSQDEDHFARLSQSSEGDVTSSAAEESEASAEMIRRTASAGATGILPVPLWNDLGIEMDVGDDLEVRGGPLRLFKDSIVVNDENNGRATLFKPNTVARTPFGQKAGGSRLFQVMRDGQEDAKVEEAPLIFAEEIDATPLTFQNISPPRVDQQRQQHLSNVARDTGDGFSMGRRPTGANRYAPLIDNMTPITERTCEFTTSTSTMTNASGLSQSQRSRRDSVFPVPVMEEEDEDEEEEDSEEEDEEDGDRAFVAEYDGEESDRSSYRNRGGASTEEEETEEEDEEEITPVQYQPASRPPAPGSLEIGSMTASNSNSSMDSRLKSGYEMRGESEERSFEVTREASLSEGYTIEGNQTAGMATGLVIGETTSFGIDRSRTQVEEVSLFPNPCNPFKSDTITQLLSIVSTPVLQRPSAYDFTKTSANKLDALQRVAKRRAEKAGSSNSTGSSSKASKDKTGVIDDVWELQLGEEVFSVRSKLGEGTFGAVFRVAAFLDTEVDEDDEDYDAEAEETSIAIKIERPTNLWEFHILQQLHSRLPARVRMSVINASKLYAYRDESFLFLDSCDQGTLLDALNKANDAGIAPPTGGASNGLEEIVAMFFMIELLRTVEAFHHVGFIHGDLKIDNCLVRLEGVENKNWSSGYNRAGEGGWSKKGLKIIDFGRTIDTTMFPTGQRFKSEFEADEFDCLEMRLGKSWTYETDYYGLASIAFSLLFGRFMETTVVESGGKGKRYMISQNFKRYQQADLWTRLFDALLNPKLIRADQSLPIIDELRTVREDMETYLEKNCDKGGKNLKALIKKMEIYSLTRYSR